MTSSAIRRIINKHFDLKQDRFVAVPGQLGDGLGNLYPGQENYVWVRTGGGLEIVFNNRVAPENDLMVMVGRDVIQPDLYQVLSTWSAFPGGTTGGAAGGFAPAKRYQWQAEGGGQDPLWVEKRQYLPGRIGAWVGMLIQIYLDIYWTGTLMVQVQHQTADLTGYLPTTAGKAAAVLVTVNATGTIITTKGAEVNFADLALSNIPATPVGTIAILGAVRVYQGQTEIREMRTNSDIIDLRVSGWTAPAWSPTTRTISTTAPLTIDGATSADLSANRTLAIIPATTSVPGSMSAADKTKLDGITAVQAMHKVFIGPVSGADASPAFRVLEVTDIPALANGDVVGPAGATGDHLTVFDGSTGKLLKDGGPVPIGAGGFGIAFPDDYILIQDQKSQNTPGGTFASGAWQTRDLTVEVADSGAYASLAGNQITLQAGTYRVHIVCPAYGVGRHQARLQNITDGTTFLFGASAYSYNSIPTYVLSYSIIVGELTITSPKVLEIQHRCYTTSPSTQGFGVECNWTTEIYTSAEFWRKKDATLTAGTTTTVLHGNAAGDPSFDAVALADMANMATSSLIYRTTAGSGLPEVNTLATLKADLGSMPAAAHNILDSTCHGDALTGSVADGSIIIGNVTPKWSALVIAVPAANVRNVLGIDNGETRPSWKTVLDTTSPAALTAAGAAAAGTSLVFAHRDHVHAITGAPALLGNGASQYQTIITGATPFAPVYSGFLLDGTTGGKTVLAVTSGKTLTLTATDNYGLTIEANSLLNQDLTTDAGPSFAHLHLADVAAIYTAAESWIGPSATAGIYFKGGVVGLGMSPTYGLDLLDSGSTPYRGGVRITEYSTGNNPTWISARSRGTLISPVAVQSGDPLGGFYFQGNKNTTPSFTYGASLFAQVDAALGTYIPTALIFQTSDASNILLERMRIGSNGNVVIGMLAGGANNKPVYADSDGHLHC